MIDSAVERQFSDTTELLGLWKAFYEFFVMAVKKDNITAEKEAQFLELKSRIAMLHDSFMEALTHNQNIGQEVLNIISRAITLRHLGKQSTADSKKMEIEWHESYLLLNETVGVLDEKRTDLAKINEKQYIAGKAAGVARQKAANFFGSSLFKLAVGTAVFLFLTVGVQSLGIYDYSDLGKISALQTPYGWGKALVRKFWNEDSPWPTIDSSARMPHSQWPSGLKAPQIQSDDKSKFFKQFPSEMQSLVPILEKATEYRKETVDKQNETATELHTFLLPDAAQAKDLEKKWADMDSASKGKLSQTYEFIRDVNVINGVYNSNQGAVNAFRVNVFKKGS